MNHAALLKINKFIARWESLVYTIYRILNMYHKYTLLLIINYVFPSVYIYLSITGVPRYSLSSTCGFSQLIDNNLVQGFCGTTSSFSPHFLSRSLSLCLLSVSVCVMSLFLLLSVIIFLILFVLVCYCCICIDRVPREFISQCGMQQFNKHLFSRAYYRHGSRCV